LVLIGPEGDFSKEEIEQARHAGFSSVSLGPNVLRTETAGIAACHILNLIQ
jgi:16S rRNA (uracil1498-N3)-methyltransferase